MNKSDIIRRERRHYRRYVNGNIVYEPAPVDGHKESTYDNKFKNNYKMKKEEGRITSLAELADENIKTKFPKKDQVIEKTLHELSDMINPDSSEIADALYNQFKNTALNIKQQEIKKAIDNNKHFRASSDQNKNLEIKDIKAVVEDVYVQVEKEAIKNKSIEKDKSDVKEAITKEISKDKNKSFKKEEPKEEKTSIRSRKKSIEKEEVKEIKPSKKKEKVSGNDLFGDNDLDLDDNDLDSDDDLGLKF
ncbi:MAG: hypothetical protein PHR26_02185 [Candidatus ainarchaeum sp.]|nr:hypothetical protein [Candidatus ainarchaeum sp.]MDD3976197.1 hypothetical protein [Candidatus ainarchaeum sp.]